MNQERERLEVRQLRVRSKGWAEIRLSRVESSSPVPSDPGSWSRGKKRQWGQGGWELNWSVSELRIGYYQGQ